MEDDSRINWKERYFEILKRVEALEARIAALESENQQLKLENQALHEKLNTSSNNSSKPPSQDPFRKTRSNRPSGRKQGGQPGHPGHPRHVYPTEQLSKVIDLKPETCPSCGSVNFDETPISVECRQVIELPEIQPEVIQYNIFTCQCGQCKKHARPIIPAEAEKGFGPRLMGFITMLSGEAGVTKRKICAIAAHLGMKISLGSICNIHRIASTILEKPFETIRQIVLNHNNVNADESSWRLKAKRCWIWIGAIPGATFFKIDPSRSQEAFNRIFQGFQNILSSDRYGAYNSHKGEKQCCLAHIDRDFEKMSEREGADGALGRILCGELDLIFALWKEFKTQALARQALQEKAQEHIENIQDALTIASSAKGITSKSVALCSDLLERFLSLWTFLYEEGVEPTNNLAERGLRPAVIQRKISGGSQSEWGLAFTERLLTVVCTFRQSSRNIFEFLTKSFRAHIQGAQAPPVFES
jgi:transposase